MQSTILITGATGFVGAHIALEFLKSGYNVKATFRSKKSLEKAKHTFHFYDTSDDLFNKISWVEADMLSYSSVRKALQDVDFVVHAAAEVSFNPRFKNRIIENNTLMASHIADAAVEAGVKKLCHISSIAALGTTIDGAPITEKDNLASVKGQSGYSTSKFYAEMEIWRAINSGLNAVILNPSIIIGPGDWNSSSPTFITTIAKGMSFYTKGVNGFVDVRDVARACRLAIESDISADRFILSSENISYQELFSSIAVKLNKSVPKHKAPPTVLRLLAKFSSLYSYLSGKEPIITPQSARSAWKKCLYSGAKFDETFNFTYTPVSDTIEFSCNCYLKNHRS